MDKIVSGEEIIALIPQKPPIVMVDTLYECLSEKAITGLTISSENMFCRDGLFREAGIIENIAQSAALKAGYEQQMRKLPPKIAYLCSIKNFILFFCPQAGDSIITTVTIMTVVGNITVFRGKVECNGKMVANCEMKMIG